MKMLLKLATLMALLLLSAGVARAYDNEVWYDNGQYHWKVGNVYQGGSSDFATAVQGAIGTGNREVHILTGGNLSSTIWLQGGLTLWCHNNTFTRSHGGDGFHREGSGNIAIYDMTLTGGTGNGIRTSRASDLTFVNVTIDGGGIGIRVDSHPSRPYEDGRWVYNLTVVDCTFENLSSHGLETYGVDGAYIDGIVANYCGESGVLLNKTVNGTVGTVHAYRCSYGGGYAGLRFANNCADNTVEYLSAVECGRGFFTVSNCTNIVVEEVYIRDTSWHAVLLQDSDGVGINSGSYNGDALNHYTSVNCWINATDVDNILGTKRIMNVASGRAMGTPGNSNGSNIDIWDYFGADAQKWIIAESGTAFTIRTSQPGNRAMDVWNWGTGNGTNIALYEYWGGDSQRFYIDPVDTGYRITPVISTGQCVDAYGTANGSNVGTWSYWGGDNQKWFIETP